MPRKKGSNQQKAADRLFTQGRSVREVARKLRISSSWAGTLRERWHDSMSPAPVAPPHPGRQSATPAPPGPAQSTDKEVLAFLADPKLRRDIEAMLAWAEKGSLSEITFEEIYRWTREICPNTERRNRLFAVWNDTQTYEKFLRDNPDYYQGLEPENVAAVEPGQRAVAATPDEQSKEDFSTAKLAAEVTCRAQRSADEVIRRYTVFRMAGDIKNLELIAANELGLFTEAQTAQAKDCLSSWPAYKPEYEK